ncbi:hypothetical protein [Burkholderia pseudomallei]
MLATRFQFFRRFFSVTFPVTRPRAMNRCNCAAPREVRVCRKRDVSKTKTISMAKPAERRGRSSRFPACAASTRRGGEFS